METKLQARYSEEVLRSQETNNDVLLLTYDRMFGKNISIVASAGGAQRTNFSKRNFTNVGELVVDGVYNLRKFKS